MSKTRAFLFVCLATVFALPALAIDGQVLINQSTVMAAGGFPYKIASPGSYKLSGNLAVPANVDGIDIMVNNVTLDLNGFTIQGPITCTGAGAALSCKGSSNPFFPTYPNGILGIAGNVTVQNGVVAGFYFGVWLSGPNYSPGPNDQVVGIVATGNSGDGIFVTQGVLRNNVASFNIDGMTCYQSCMIIGNQANFNALHGIEAGIGLYGGNDLQGNGEGPLSTSPGSVSQGNNACGGVVC